MNPPASSELASQASPSAPSSTLSFRRLWQDEAPLPAHALGGRWVGAAGAALQAPMLAREGAALDAWFVQPNSVQARTLGCVSYATDGHWLYGCASVDEAGIGMQAAAERAYADLFAVLAATPCAHLLRLWNYFAHINRDEGGTERYRQFNAGRQQAFLDARRSAFEGSPAACALGTQGGPLLVSFLAGRLPPTAIENPRQVSAYRYPASYGPRAPTFSRGALADMGGGQAMLFISGTASIVGHASLHLGDVARQTEESLANIALVRDAASAQSHRAAAPEQMHYTVYLRQAADLPLVREVFERHVGHDSPAARGAIYLQADICRAELLVEIEAHGLALPMRGAA